MDKTIDLAALGELLIDFTQVSAANNEGAATAADPSTSAATGEAATLFRRNAGGAPANVLAMAAHLGLTTQFIGKIGADAQGAFLRAALEREGVGTSGLVEDARAFTTLAFVEVDPATGERTFSFARKPGADTLLRPEEIHLETLRSCRVLHVGSVSLTDDPARSATLFAVDEAADAGALISYDPNYRADLWPSVQAALDEMSGIMGSADLVKMNLEEATLICGATTAEDAAQAILARGASLAAVTLGNEGALLATRTCSVRTAACPCRASDTTGAGDAFWGAALAWLLHERNVRTHEDLDELTADELAECGAVACAAAACCVERPGGIPSMPSASEVRERMASVAAGA